MRRGIAARRSLQADSFSHAFDWAMEQSAPGEIVLLSPGCASYGWFRNYEERGRRFAEEIRKWDSTST